jgi:uncharacterized protein with HEPN domain
VRGKRRDAQRIEDMRQAIREIEEGIGDLDREGYGSDRKTQKAVAFDIMIIGDAASKVS